MTGAPRWMAGYWLDRRLEGAYLALMADYEALLVEYQRLEEAFLERELMAEAWG